MPREQKADLQDPMPLCPTGATGVGMGKERYLGTVQAPRISDYNLTDILSYYKVTSKPYSLLWLLAGTSFCLQKCSVWNWNRSR